MTNKPLFYPLIVILSLCIFVACKKGDTGPEGPAGPAGPAGPTGPAGQDGAAVTYSDWLDVAFEPNIDSSNWLASIEAPAITPDILNQGEIKVYINLNDASDPVVFPLPYFDGAVIINPVFVTDSILLVSTIDAGTFIDTTGGGNAKILQYRYVVIPGSNLAAARKNVNLDIYADVKKYFKIKD